MIKAGGARSARIGSSFRRCGSQGFCRKHRISRADKSISGRRRKRDPSSSESESELEDAFINAWETKHAVRSCPTERCIWKKSALARPVHIEVQVSRRRLRKTPVSARRARLFPCSSTGGRVIEETPCPVLSEDTRQRMFDAARAAVSAAGYHESREAAELLLDGDGNSLLHRNETADTADLQVEHAVSEEVSGIDIVKWQIRIASKLPLSFTQDDVVLRGHSIECRVNAKSQGQIDFLHLPSTTRVHFDSALVQGERISPLYDSMLGKLVVYAPTRDEAIRKTEASLAEVAIQGVETNIDDLHTIIFEDAFQSGEYDTSYLEKLFKK